MAVYKVAYPAEGWDPPPPRYQCQAQAQTEPREPPQAQLQQPTALQEKNETKRSRFRLLRFFKKERLEEDKNGDHGSSSKVRTAKHMSLGGGEPATLCTMRLPTSAVDTAAQGSSALARQGRTGRHCLGVPFLPTRLHSGTNPRHKPTARPACVSVAADHDQPLINGFILSFRFCHEPRLPRQICCSIYLFEKC